MIKTPKKICWDLEFKASQTFRGDLRAAPGYIMCFGWKEIGSKDVHAISLLDYPGKSAIDDSVLVRKIYDILKDVDLHVFHYGTKCDWKFIQTRLLRWGYDLLPARPMVFDTHSIASKYLSIKSNSLKSLAYFFGLKESKMEIYEDVWLLANAGDKKALRKIVDRCKSDVRLTEKVYENLLQLAQNHPLVYKIQELDEPKQGVPERCETCGKKSGFTWNGYTATAKTVLRRYRCRREMGGCGSSVFLPVQRQKE